MIKCRTSKPQQGIKKATQQTNSTTSMPRTEQQTSPKLQATYRPEIDGLRAIAVLAVVCFHAFPNSIKSGFIGVDVFFVISGFLISTIILRALETGKFDLGEFYRRRITRIFPALTLVLGACLAAGWWVLLAAEYKQLGAHTAGGATFISNLMLWRESGYFDNASETKPLLHLWSLGIEEQFYIVWPLVLWGLWKLKLNVFLFTLVILVATFGLNVFILPTDPVRTFYSPLTRAWELLAGALIALVSSTGSSSFGLHVRRSPLVLNVFAFVGLGLLIVGFLTISKSSAFPGWWAVLPVTASALIILSGSDTWLSRAVLSHPVLVWFGLISFPLYLWHWPLLSFARVIESELPDRNIRIALVLTSTVLAWLTYQFIERPLRENQQRNWRTPLTISAALFTVALAGFFIYAHDGLPSRKNAELTLLEGETGHNAFHQYITQNYFLCTDKPIAEGSLRWQGMIQCGQSKAHDKIDLAIIGDSHAEHIFVGLADSLHNKNVAFYIRNSAPYLSNPEFSTVYDRVLNDQNIKQVILTMWWIGRSNQNTKDEILRIASKLLANGKQVFITDDVPNFSFDPQKCKGKRWLSTSDPTCLINQANATGQAYVRLLNEIIAADPRIKLISTLAFFCNAKTCSMERDGKLLYRDFNHLNVNGSKYIGTSIAAELDRVAAQGNH